MNGKTFRVPRKVRQQAEYGLRSVQSFSSVPPESLQVAYMLASGDPVGPAVPDAMRQFFRMNPWERGKSPLSQLHGGKYGKEWARRCMAIVVEQEPITASAEEDLDERPPWDLTDDEVETMLRWARTMRGAAEDESGALGAEAGESAEVIEQAVDVEEVAERLLEEGTGEPPPPPDELSMAATEARRRMDSVTLERQYRELAARMGGPVGTAATGATEGEGGNAGDADPKAG